MPRAISPRDLAALVGAGAEVRIIDVRKRPAFDADPVVIAGAGWGDPELVEDWGPALREGPAVVCYCVHGHEVSQGAAARLDQLGVDVRYLEGGIEEWKAFGGATAAKG